VRLEDAPEQPGGRGHDRAKGGALQVRMVADKAVEHGTEPLGGMVDPSRGQLAPEPGRAVGHHAVVRVGVADVDAEKGHGVDRVG